MGSDLQGRCAESAEFGWRAVMACAVAAALAGCSKGSAGAPAGAEGAGGEGGPTADALDGEGTPSPGWTSLHAAIFAPSCALSACHAGATGVAGLRFDDAETSYAALIEGIPRNGPAAAAGLRLVAPGDPDRSFLLHKVSHSAESLAAAGHGAPMPVGNFDRLGPGSLNALRAWIAAGAPFDGGPVEADFVAPPEASWYVSCSETEEAAMQECFPPPSDPEAVVRIHSPVLTVPPATDIQLCSILPTALPEELFITGADGMQFHGGHHIALYTAAASLPPGTVDCDTLDMAALRFVVQGGGGLNTTLPDGLAMRVPGGQQLVVQSHYINTTGEPLLVMDTVDLRVITPTADTVLADSFAMLDSDFEIPPFTFGYERVKECEIVEPMEIVMLLGHTHERGSLFRVELVPAGGQPTELYYATDGATLRDNPEVKIYEDPLVLSPGDRLRMTCGWDNDTASPVRWPEEMCVTFTYYTPGRGWLVCDTYDQHPKALGAGEGEPCAQPGDVGNDVGVGTYCTVSGGECAAAGAANFCLASFSATNNYCSIIFCSSDDECGEGARCIADTAGSACILDACDAGE